MFNHLNLTEKLGLRTFLISFSLVFPIKVLIGNIGGGAPPVTDLSEKEAHAKISEYLTESQEA